MKKAPWIYGLILVLAIVATARFAPSKPFVAPRAGAAVDETWTIPGAGRTAGQNNTQFVSDLALTNLGSATANVTISFVGPGGLPAKPITLAAGATTVYRNVLDALWSATGLVGALSVHADQPLVLRARTYNTAATGTFGVALPVYASDHLLGEGQTGDSLWIEQSPSGTTGFRTNVGVVFPDTGGGEAVVALYDAAGASVGTLNYSSATAGFQQQSVASAVPSGLPVGRALISVTRGHAAGYAVGVDNVTGDTSLYPLEALPAGVQDVVVSGVARLTGRNNTFFRTDARFYNQTPNDVTVTARFHAVGPSNPTPQSATLTVSAGRILEVVDVLGSILNAPVGSGGAVRFTADQPIAILCRTSNVDPQGVRPGTFGAQQRPVPIASFLSSADAGAVVTAIRQDTGFRTNIGFAAGPDGAAYNLSLRNAQGNVVAVTTGSLGVFGWAQPGIADLFPGTSIPADATLLVQVTSGTVDVYDASLDNSSGDLVVTPIAPVPAAISSSAQIGPSGGSIRSADGRLTLRIPNGALASTATLSIDPTTNGAPNSIGPAYSLSPSGVHFGVPAQIVLSYSAGDLVGTGPGALGIASLDGSTWYAIVGGSVDPVTRTLRVPVNSTSPGPAPTAGGQIPQRSSQNGTIAPFAAVVVTPTESSVVEGDTQNVETDFVGPSSSQQATSVPGLVMIPAGISPADVRVIWYVNGNYYGNLGAAGTITPPSADIFATYTAPRCAPTSPVEIKAVASLWQNGSPGPWSESTARIRVIPKRWAIDVFYRLHTACSGTVFTVQFCRSHEFGTFVLSNRQVDSYRSGPEHGRGTDSSAWCFASPCAQPVLDTVSDLSLTDLTGRLDGPGLDPSFFLTVSADVPGEGAKLNITCGGGPVEPQPIIHGAHAHEVQPVRINYVNYPDLKNYVTFPTPFTDEHVEVVLRPISCDLVAAPQTSSCN